MRIARIIAVSAVLSFAGSAPGATLFDNGNHVFGLRIASNNNEAADDFALLGPANVTGIIWKGSYGGMTADETDNFEIRFYLDNGSGQPTAPGTAIYDQTIGAVTPIPTGDPPALGAYTIYQYSAAIPSFSAIGGQRYWLEIFDKATADSWLWSVDATGGNGVSTEFSNSWNSLTDDDTFQLLGTTVPEPSTLILLGLSGLLLLAFRKLHSRLQSTHLHGLLSIVSALSCLIAFTLAPAAQAHAAVSLVTSRATLAGTDSLNWANAAQDFHAISNPFSMNSNGSIPVTVSEATLSFDRLTQPTTFEGNFSPSDPVLYTGFSLGNGLGPITIDFGSQLLSAFGSQIMAVPPGAFTAELDVYNGATLEGTVTEGGTSAFTNDGSAIFIGLTSTIPFDKVVISVPTDSGQINDFGINQADFIPVPEPSTIALLTTGALGFVFLTRCRFAHH